MHSKGRGLITSMDQCGRRRRSLLKRRGKALTHSNAMEKTVIIHQPPIAISANTRHQRYSHKYPRGEETNHQSLRAGKVPLPIRQSPLIVCVCVLGDPTQDTADRIPSINGTTRRARWQCGERSFGTVIMMVIPMPWHMAILRRAPS